MGDTAAGVGRRFFQVFVPAGHDLILVVSDVDGSNAGIGKLGCLGEAGFAEMRIPSARRSRAVVAALANVGYGHQYPATDCT